MCPAPGRAQSVLLTTALILPTMGTMDQGWGGKVSPCNGAGDKDFKDIIVPTKHMAMAARAPGEARIAEGGTPERRRGEGRRKSWRRVRVEPCWTQIPEAGWSGHSQAGQRNSKGQTFQSPAGISRSRVLTPVSDGIPHACRTWHVVALKSSCRMDSGILFTPGSPSHPPAI